MEDEDRTEETARHPLEPPEPTVHDRARKLVIAATSSLASGVAAANPESLIIDVSTFLELLWAEPLEKRLGDWRWNLVKALVDLMARMRIAEEQLQNNDAFLDVSLQASLIAMRTSQEEKRTALRNTILNAALPDSIDLSYQQMFLSYIDIFTVWHIKILKLMQGPLAWGSKNDHKFLLGGVVKLASTITSAYPELIEKPQLYNQVWQDMQQRGLVTKDGLSVGMEAPNALVKRTTDFGDLFLKYIEEPN